MLPSDFAGTSRVPPYSAEPAIDERILNHTEPSFRAVPTGSYTRSNEFLQMTLKEQVDGLEIPTYGQRGLVKGEVTLRDPQNVVSVDLKVLTAA